MIFRSIFIDKIYIRDKNLSMRKLKIAIEKRAVLIIMNIKIISKDNCNKVYIYVFGASIFHIKKKKKTNIGKKIMHLNGIDHKFNGIES